jgi:toxin ParE1/3/4
MKVRYTATALSEIEEIFAWIVKDNPPAAARVATAIERTVAWIADHPEAAPVVFETNVRAKLVGRYQYRVFFSMEGSELVFRNVRSTRRRRPWEPD